MDHSYHSSSSEMEHHSAASSELFQERTTIDVTERMISDKSGAAGRYTGSIDAQNDRPHGEGRMEYENQTYDGQWVDGDWSGFGTHTDNEKGEIYEGGFFDNKRHGQGVLNYADGRIYDGTFQMGDVGKGKMSYPDGSIFWGYFNLDFVPHGRGKFNYPDGSVYDGEFVDGMIEGHGRMTWKDGRWYLGEWSHGEKNGIGIEVRADGSICHEGTFSNGTAVTGSSFTRRRRSNEGFLLYPSSRTLGKTNTLIGPIPTNQKTVRRSSLDMGRSLLMGLRGSSKRSLLSSGREHPIRTPLTRTASQ